MGEIPTQDCLNQTKMQQLAEAFTQPRKGLRYRDPAYVKAVLGLSKLDRSKCGGSPAGPQESPR